MNSTHPADRSFAVHLDSLLGFAQELTTQVHGVAKPAGELEALLSTPIAPGSFNEASSLAASHATAVAQMHGLLADVQQALAFANDVTTTVADGYQRVDGDLGAYLSADGVLAGSGSDGHAGANTPGLAGQLAGIAGTGSAGTGTAGTGVDVGGVTVGGRLDGHPGLQLGIGDATATAGPDGVHIDTGGAVSGVASTAAGTVSSVTGAATGVASAATGAVSGVTSAIPALPVDSPDPTTALPVSLPPVTGV